MDEHWVIGHTVGMLHSKSASGVLLCVTALALSLSSAKAGEVIVGWHQGHWVHDRHGGRLGWWWVVGNHWNYYQRPYVYPAPQQTVIMQPAQPVIIQQAPPPPVQQAPQTVVEAAPQTPVLFYCKATGTHYPETMTCPGGWSTHTATTPPQP